MMSDTAKSDAYAFGRYAETQAAAFLRRRGYDILDMNYRIRAAELDIVASMNGALAFIEVKARNNLAYGYPREAVTYQKQARVARAAQSWLYKHGMDDANVRFDIIEVYHGRIVHWRNAFESPEEVA